MPGQRSKLQVLERTGSRQSSCTGCQSKQKEAGRHQIGQGKDGIGLEQERDQPAMRSQVHANAGLQVKAKRPARSPQAWARQTNVEEYIGVVAVQETHWSQDLSFHMDGWLALTSPCLDKVSGILLLVNLRHFHRHHVQFTSVLAGASSICARRVNPPRMSSLAINISMQVRRLPRVLLVLSNPWPNATYGGLSCIRPSPAFRLGTRFWLLEISTLTSSRTCPLSGRAPALALAECLLTELSRI